MKKIALTVLLALSIFVNAWAQEADQSTAENEQTLIKINILDPVATPKIYVSKYSNFAGKKLLCQGSGEGYVDSQYKYIGFGKTSLQPLKLDSKVIEFNAELGNPVLNTIGIAAEVVGFIGLGAGIGFMAAPLLDGETSGFKDPRNWLMVGSGALLGTGGIILNTLFKPKLIRIN